MAYDNIIGKTIERVETTQQGEVVTFRFQDGTLQRYRTESECCSRSWIEHLELPNDVRGAQILSVAESASVKDPETEAEMATAAARALAEVVEEADEVVKVYHVTFRTNRGDIVLEFRNSSNGYYGGSLVEDDEDVSATA